MTAQDQPIVVPLAPGDFIALLIRREGRDYYGMGFVREVDHTGRCLVWAGANDHTHNMTGVKQTWGLQASSVHSAALESAIRDRRGRPFDTLEDLTTFARQYAIQSETTIAPTSPDVTTS